MAINQHTTRTGEAAASTRARLVAVPASEPAPVSVGALAAAPLPQAAKQMVLALRTGGGAQRWESAQDADPVVQARPSGEADLPDPASVCATLAAAVVEVLSGRRSPAQLTRWTTMEVQEGLMRRLALANRLRPARGQRAAVVRRVRVTHPADGVVEAAAVVMDTDRVRAVALRLEGWDRRWRLTALEVG